MVVKMDKIVDYFCSLLESLDLLAVDTLGFKDREEIFSHSVVVAAPTS